MHVILISPTLDERVNKVIFYDNNLLSLVENFQAIIYFLNHYNTPFIT